ncbi:E3 ubiquitin-protein ligase complex SLX5-SLX8 subunit SLX5 [Candida tropicalis]
MNSDRQASGESLPKRRRLDNVSIENDNINTISAEQQQQQQQQPDPSETNITNNEVIELSDTDNNNETNIVENASLISDFSDALFVPDDPVPTADVVVVDDDDENNNDDDDDEIEIINVNTISPTPISHSESRNNHTHNNEADESLEDIEITSERRVPESERLTRYGHINNDSGISFEVVPPSHTTPRTNRLYTPIGDIEITNDDLVARELAMINRNGQHHFTNNLQSIDERLRQCHIRQRELQRESENLRQLEEITPRLRELSRELQSTDSRRLELGRERRRIEQALSSVAQQIEQLTRMRNFHQQRTRSRPVQPPQRGTTVRVVGSNFNMMPNFEHSGVGRRGPYSPGTRSRYEASILRVLEEHPFQFLVSTLDGDSDAERDIERHIMARIEEDTNQMLDSRIAREAGFNKKVVEDRKKRISSEKPNHTSTINKDDHLVCELCNIELGEGVPEDFQGDVRYDSKFQHYCQEYECTAPWFCIYPFTKVDIDLSKRAFISKCGHLFCGRCVKNIGNRPKRKTKESKLISIKNPNIYAPAKCPEPDCAKRFTAKSFTEIYF